MPPASHAVTCGGDGLRLGQVEQLRGGQHAAVAAPRLAVQIRALCKRLIEQHLNRVVVVDTCDAQNSRGQLCRGCSCGQLPADEAAIPAGPHISRTTLIVQELACWWQARLRMAEELLQHRCFAGGDCG